MLFRLRKSILLPVLDWILVWYYSTPTFPHSLVAILIELMGKY